MNAVDDQQKPRRLLLLLSDNGDWNGRTVCAKGDVGDNQPYVRLRDTGLRVGQGKVGPNNTRGCT